MRKRLVELDALRGIATIIVVIYHYTTRYNSLYGHEDFFETFDFTVGKQGVQLFFMISGFVIFLTLNHVKKPMDFIVSRLSRLYPPYWIAIICTFSIVYFWGLPGRQVSHLTALKNMIMFHDYLGIPNVDGVYWTLKVELTFYFWMFIAYLSNSLRKIEIYIMGLVLFNLFVHLTGVNIYHQLPHILLFKHLPFFGIGICLYKIFYNEYSKFTFVTLALCLIVTLILNSANLFVLYLLFTIIFYLGIKGKIGLLSNKIFVFVGLISYSLYLLHQNIGYVIINKGYSLGLNPLISISLAIIIVTVMSYASYRLVETPSTKLIKKYYKQLGSIPQLIKDKRKDNNIYAE